MRVFNWALNFFAKCTFGYLPVLWGHILTPIIDDATHKRYSNSMRILPRKTALSLLFFLSILIFSNSNTLATTNVSLSLPIEDVDAQTGHIVSVRDGNYILSFSSDEPGIFGVITDDPIVSLTDTSLSSFKYVTTSGEALVKVSAINGAITEGDFITASKIPGVGQKATQSGQVLGVALESYDPENPNDDQGEIAVFINITSAFVGERLDQDLIGLLKSGFQVPFVTPLTSLRYILAAMIALISFFIGFSSFGRISINGIEALGRNPLAGRLIKSAIFLNFVFTLGIMAIGLVISYLILTF